MERKEKYKRYLIFILLITIFTNCRTNNPANIIGNTTPKTSEIVQTTATETVQVQTPAITVEPTKIFTAAPDMRIPPDEWQDWPIIPTPTNRSKEIYKHGKELGVNISAFSKIGDCQNIKEAFMGIYDLNRYYLAKDQQDWQETIDHFKGYFNRDGKSIEQGLNVAAALSPLQADPEECQPAEGPLQCELRITNPSFAFISFERWWPDVTPPEQYEKYLRQVIQIVIDNGTVPILVTKADNIEGNHQINAIIAKLAYEYDIPLYNWWKAAQPLPHHGMDPERNDSFHISIDAWTERSAYALGTLDSLWKGLKDT